ncbi:ATP-binding protein [Amycolatopsis sp. YIM 10]|uniref:ATP-binding protein n=1 Tax=Amycolatopsis sp. YIM 10 TaxID=2653857 RepID=UPI001D150952|nr:ATP-binding protein [Amycolatopsis sp. YIM 10]
MLDLSGNPAELGRVRRWARSRLTGLDPALLADAVGALDELTSNAIRHGAPPRRVRLRRAPSLLRIEVSDGSPEPAEYRTPDNDGGRGLRLVDAYVSAWGQTMGDAGKTVWADIALGPKPT